MRVTVHPETDGDFEAIRAVNRAAFGREDEARLVDALREGGYTVVSLVAEIEDQVVGHILFSSLKIVTDRASVPAVALAPLAVLPEHQRQGIGLALVRRGLEDCRDAGYRVAVVVGHPAYYPRFGFSAELASRLRSPYSGPSCMAMELVRGALSGLAGELEYAPPFSQF